MYLPDISNIIRFRVHVDASFWCLVIGVLWRIRQMCFSIFTFFDILLVLTILTLLLFLVFRFSILIYWNEKRKL